VKIAGKNQQAICQVEGEIESLSQELAGMFGGNVVTLTVSMAQTRRLKMF